MRKIKNYVKYYFWASYRRKILDKLLERNKHYYRGIVLDIGGRDRGKFKKPKNNVKKWIFADIEKKYNPDIVLDVCNMKEIGNESVDVVSAIELFEHVKNPQKGIEECYRVLKKGGAMILTVPFLYPVHSDPYDFQRWTRDKWTEVLKGVSFEIKKFVIMGLYFTIMMENKKFFIKQLPFGIRHFCKLLFYPIMDLFIKLDNTKWVKNNLTLNKFHGGYFVVLKKIK